MSTDLDHAIKSAVSDIVAAAPDATDDPTVVLITPASGSTPRRLLPAAAAVLIVAAGVTGIVLASRGSPSQTSPAATEQPDGPALTDAKPEITAPATTADPARPCSDGTGETTVPNVAGMSYDVAIATLNAAGVGFEVVPMVPDGGSATYGYVVAKQDTTPGDTLACGDVVVLTVADRPKINYTIQPGDTWESIASVQGIAIDDLLDANGVTLATLEASGETVASPLDPGRTITLLLPATLENAPATTIG
jgi:hypothetical protein